MRDTEIEGFSTLIYINIYYNKNLLNKVLHITT